MRKVTLFLFWALSMLGCYHKDLVFDLFHNLHHIQFFFCFSLAPLARIRSHNSVSVGFSFVTQPFNSCLFSFSAWKPNKQASERVSEFCVGGAPVAEIQVFLIIYLSINQFGFIRQSDGFAGTNLSGKGVQRNAKASEKSLFGQKNTMETMTLASNSCSTLE